MTFHLLLAAFASALPLVAGLALGYRTRPTPSKPGGFRLAGVVMVLLGGALTVYDSFSIVSGLQRKNWPTAEGVATTVEVNNTFPNVIFRYTVDGKSYEGETDLATPQFGFSTDRRETAQKIAGQVREADSLSVFYNPSDPADSYLIPGPLWNQFVRFAVGGFLLLFGSWTLGASFGRASEKAQP